MFSVFLGLFQAIFAWEDAITVFFLIFWIFLQFFMNFLLRVGLERNGMIIFIFPVSRSIPTYYGMKWSNNGIFKFSEFFFSIFLEFSITCRVGMEWNGTIIFIFSLFGQVSTYFFFKWSQNGIILIFWIFLLFVWNFLLGIG